MTDLFRRSLTLREHEILLLIAAGASAKEIARVLHIATRTVEAHINHLKLKTSANNRAHLVAVALQMGLIPNPCDDDLGAMNGKHISTADEPIAATAAIHSVQDPPRGIQP